MITEPIVEDLGIKRFYWYVYPEDFDEEGNLHINIKAGRLRHKWVPTTAASAKRYLLEDSDMSVMRAEHDDHQIIKINMPVGLEDLTEKYPNVGPNMRGAVIKVPFELTINKKREDDEPYFTGKTLVTTHFYEIEQLDMGLMKEDECRDISTVQILVPEGLSTDVTAQFPHGVPVKDGLHDLRMGSTDKEQRCETCGIAYDDNTKQNTDTCEGHFGHIELPIYIPKYMYLGERGGQARQGYPIMHVLNSVCLHCSRVNIPEESITAITPKINNLYDNRARNVKARGEVVKTLVEARTAYHVERNDEGRPVGTDAKQKTDRKPCPHCGLLSARATFGHKKREAEFRLKDIVSVNGNDTQILDYGTVHGIFDNIRDDECRLLGMDSERAHPRDLFFKYLPVLPNYARPIRYMADRVDYDDMTYLLKQVLTVSNRLHDAINRQGEIHGRTLFIAKELYHAVTRLADNQSNTIKSGGSTTEWSYQGGSREVSYKGVLNRFGGKKGRFRNNLQSKYVENVTYSVISPDGDLSLQEIGVPLSTCMSLTYPEKVTSENIEQAREWVRNGPHKHPGANWINRDGTLTQRSGSTNLAVSEEKRESFADDLTEGVVIYRHIMDGDICLFNRAPSLHRQSIMGFRVRVVPGKSFTMNATICDPFNADFDGDAMKVHFVQSEEARKEAEGVMLLTNNLIHARYGRLAIANDQDQVSGLYLLTHTDLNRADEWNASTGTGFTSEGIPYFSKEAILHAYSKVYSEIRDIDLLEKMYREHKKLMKSKAMTKAAYMKKPHYRYIESLPAPDYGKYYTGKSLYSHLFKVLGCEYVTARFQSNAPVMERMIVSGENGDFIDQQVKITDGKVEKQEVFVENGVIIEGTLDKDSFGVGESSLAPSFIYHEGYEKGQAKLSEFIELSTRLGLAAHHLFGYTIDSEDLKISPKARRELDGLYESYAAKIEEVDRAWEEKDVHNLSLTDDEGNPLLDNRRKNQARMEPRDVVEQIVDDLESEYQKRMTRLIENDQGSGNSLQISIKSKARGSEENIRQISGGFGLVRIDDKRIMHGIEPNRVLPHFNRGEQTSTQRGFIRSGYSEGLSPTEYWFTTSAGRRSAAESGQGNIAKSGYLERKLIKTMESYVVNQRRHVTNLRSGRITSLNVGDDGLLPYHIRGSDERVNKSGAIITLQPLLFEYKCKHDEYLADDCSQCDGALRGFADIDYFEMQLESSEGHPVSDNTKKKMRQKIQERVIGKVTLRKMAESLLNFYQDSLCRVGEAIGSVAAASIGEPATQAALRTFHFAGKESYQGSIKRMEQILESPMTAASGSGADTPKTKVYMKEKYNDEASAKKMARNMREVQGKDIIRVIKYKIEPKLVEVYFDEEAMEALAVNESVLLKQVRKVMKDNSFRCLTTEIEYPIVGQMDGVTKSAYLYLKEKLMNTTFSGLSKTSDIYVGEDDGKHYVEIRNAEKSLLDLLVELYSDVIDSIETNNIKWIYDNFGLEAALSAIYMEIGFQMNGDSESRGIGDYDMRYARVISDAMGETGIVNPTGPAGFGAMDNYSLLAGMSMEGIKEILSKGTSMGNIDPLNGIAESVVAGQMLKIGDYAPY